MHGRSALRTWLRETPLAQSIDFLATLTRQDIDRYDESEHEPLAIWTFNYVHILGLLVSVDIRDTEVKYIIDDGTGIFDALKQRKMVKMPDVFGQASSLMAAAEPWVHEFQVGQLVRAVGRIGFDHGVPRLVLKSVNFERLGIDNLDSTPTRTLPQVLCMQQVSWNMEIEWMVTLRRLKRLYQRPCSLRAYDNFLSPKILNEPFIQAAKQYVAEEKPRVMEQPVVTKEIIVKDVPLTTEEEALTDFIKMRPQLTCVESIGKTRFTLDLFKMYIKEFFEVMTHQFMVKRDQNLQLAVLRWINTGQGLDPGLDKDCPLPPIFRHLTLLQVPHLHLIARRTVEQQQDGKTGRLIEQMHQLVTTALDQMTKDGSIAAFKDQKTLPRICLQQHKTMPEWTCDFASFEAFMHFRTILKAPQDFAFNLPPSDWDLAPEVHQINIAHPSRCYAVTTPYLLGPIILALLKMNLRQEGMTISQMETAIDTINASDKRVRLYPISDSLQRTLDYMLHTEDLSRTSTNDDGPSVHRWQETYKHYR